MQFYIQNYGVYDLMWRLDVEGNRRLENHKKLDFSSFVNSKLVSILI